MRAILSDKAVGPCSGHVHKSYRDHSLTGEVVGRQRDLPWGRDLTAAFRLGGLDQISQSEAPQRRNDELSIAPPRKAAPQKLKPSQQAIRSPRDWLNGITDRLENDAGVPLALSSRAPEGLPKLQGGKVVQETMHDHDINCSTTSWKSFKRPRPRIHTVAQMLGRGTSAPLSICLPEKSMPTTTPGSQSFPKGWTTTQNRTPSSNTVRRGHPTHNTPDVAATEGCCR